MLHNILIIIARYLPPVRLAPKKGGKVSVLNFNYAGFYNWAHVTQRQTCQ